MCFFCGQIFSSIILHICTKVDQWNNIRIPSITDIGIGLNLNIDFEWKFFAKNKWMISVISYQNLRHKKSLILRGFRAENGARTRHL